MSKLTEVVVSKLHSIALCWAAEEDWLESLEFFQPFWLDLLAEKVGIWLNIQGLPMRLMFPVVFRPIKVIYEVCAKNNWN